MNGELISRCSFLRVSSHPENALRVRLTHICMVHDESLKLILFFFFVLRVFQKPVQFHRTSRVILHRQTGPRLLLHYLPAPRGGPVKLDHFPCDYRIIIYVLRFIIQFFYFFAIVFFFFVSFCFFLEKTV